jgi:transcriptional regulator with XRE-family HTH domain
MITTPKEPAAAAALPIADERQGALLAARAAINAYVGGRVRQLRRTSGASRAALAAILGLTDLQIEGLEQGHAALTLDQAWLIARYFSVEPGYLFDGMSDAVVAGLLTAAVDEPADPPDPPEWLGADNSRFVLAFAQELQNCRSRALARDLLHLLRAANRCSTPAEGGVNG